MQLRYTRGRKLYIESAPAIQAFSAQWLMQALMRGWARCDGNHVLFPGENGLVAYRIMRDPGTYCCHCGMKCGGGADAVAHVETRHVGVVSPDGENPAGYTVINCYVCHREA